MTHASTRSLSETFLHSEEGRLFLLGCLMLIAWVCVGAALCHSDHPWWAEIFGVAVAHMFAGKAVSIAQGIAIGMPGGLIASISIYADMTALFITYPILIFSYKHFVDRPFYEKHVKHIFESAQKGLDRVGHSKIVGLFAFVWFPFWMTGVIVGAVLGFLMGMRTWAIMLTVMIGTTSAVICWVFAYDYLFGWVTGIGEPVLYVFIGLIILAVVIHHIRRRRRRIAASARGD
jgi:uncharacterized membrane protein